MAGSLTRFQYDLDGNGLVPPRSIILNLDESNLEALGFSPITAAQGQTIIAPDPEIVRVRPRYILLVGRLPNGNEVTRRIVMPDPNNTRYRFGGSVMLPVLVGNTVVNTVFLISGSVGERKTFAQLGNDTGQTDGDSP